MQAHGVTVLINVVNWNGGSQRAQTDRWYRDRIREIRAEVGSAGVLLQGLSEPEGGPQRLLSKAFEWQRIAREEWHGAFVAYAFRSSTPFFATVYDYVDTHHCHLGRALEFMRSAGPRVINDTDCGPMIASRLALGVAGRLTRRAIDHHTNLHIYDHDRAAVNEGLINEMAQEIRGV